MVYKININLSSRTLAILGVLGVTFVVLGVYVGFNVLPSLITNKIWETKILKEKTEQWDIFKKTPFPFTFKVHLFDIQNPDEVLQGAKPKVNEIGPFVYKVFKWKNEIEWTNPDEISYNSYLRFEFDTEASKPLTEDTELTILNTAYLSIIYKVEINQPEMFSIVETALPAAFGDNDGLFIRVKAGDYLFRGIKFCKNGGKDGGLAATILCKKIMAKINEAVNLRVENGSVLFANMYYKNNTHLGRFTIKSGESNKEESSILHKYNGNKSISVWSGNKSTCNAIRGVTTVFPPNIKTDMVFESYAEDICRHVSLVYDSEVIVKDLKGFKFVASNKTFDNRLEENSCFCLNKSRTFDANMGCVKSGITDLSPCKGSPVMVSFPHLLYADKEYLESTDGLNPDRNIHEPFIVLEPLSGVPLFGAQRIQFNMFLRPVDGMGITANVSRSLIPLIWVEESFIIPDNFIEKLNVNLFQSLKIMNVIKWLVIISGGICALFAGLVLIYRQGP